MTLKLAGALTVTLAAAFSHLYIVLQSALNSPTLKVYVPGSALPGQVQVNERAVPAANVCPL